MHPLMNTPSKKEQTIEPENRRSRPLLSTLEGTAHEKNSIYYAIIAQKARVLL